MNLIKGVLLFNLLLAASSLFSQDLSALEPLSGVKVEKYRYVFLSGGPKITNDVNVLVLDSKTSKVSVVMDAKGKAFAFGSTLEAFSYLGERGWEYTGDLIDKSGFERHYIFRQPLQTLITK
jgi:hypothetical protein